MSGICESCGKPSTLLCDGRVIDGQRVPMSDARKATGTCDAPICRACAKQLSTYHMRTSKGCRWDSIDLCPKCAAVNAEVSK